MLLALNQIGSKQACPMQKEQKIQLLFNYAATYPNTSLCLCAYDMILHIDSNAAYLVLPKAYSCIAGYFHLASTTLSMPTHSNDNGAILIECKGLQHVVSSAAEAETYAIFTMPKEVFISTISYCNGPRATSNCTTN